METRPKLETRKLWKVWLYAAATAVNLLATGILVRHVLGGGDFTLHGIIGVVLTGVFAAFLVWELRKPKADPDAGFGADGSP